MKRPRSKEKMSQKSSPQHGGDVEKLSYAIYIPLDLTVDILSTLPLKSLVRFQCVSKLWSSLITDSIKTRSLTQPCLLVLLHNLPWRLSSLISSSTYPLNTNKTFIIADKESHTFTRELGFHFVSRYVRGLICCLSRSDEFAIYNPTTRQSVVLPGIKYDKFNNSMDGFFGYDPVEKQYKVLCYIKRSRFGERSCQVFTLGSPQQLRNINVNFARDDDDHRPTATTSVCINGIIYYVRKSYGSVLGTFDVRFERFGHIQMPESEFGWSTLVNYQGKLGCIRFNLDGAEMWILEGDHIEWSKIGSFLPPHLLDALHYTWHIAGVTRNGEIVIMPSTLCSDETLYAYFHDPKQNETRKVELESNFKGTLKIQVECYIFSEPDHMENKYYALVRESN